MSLVECLFGSKSVGNILLFLFVNQKCYGTQLSRFLKMPLTPLQKALGRLEKQRIIKSFNAGKTKLYQFNPDYPLLAELELLLKKSYTLLTADQKKSFHFYEFEADQSKKKQQFELIFKIWKQLQSIKKLTFTAHTRAHSGWQGRASAKVLVINQGNGALLFQEQGVWKGETGKEINFTNRFKWTLDRVQGMISLEHVRFGVDHPVFLMHLVPKGENLLESLDSHLCGEDTYFGQIRWNSNEIFLSWRVIGPKKNESIECVYT